MANRPSDPLLLHPLLVSLEHLLDNISLLTKDLSRFLLQFPLDLQNTERPIAYEINADTKVVFRCYETSAREIKDDGKTK